jgi:hypothetical protein
MPIVPRRYGASLSSLRIEKPGPRHHTVEGHPVVALLLGEARDGLDRLRGALGIQTNDDPPAVRIEHQPRRLAEPG